MSGYKFELESVVFFFGDLLLQSVLFEYMTDHFVQRVQFSAALGHLATLVNLTLVRLYIFRADLAL